MLTIGVGLGALGLVGATRWARRFLVVARLHRKRQREKAAESLWAPRIRATLVDHGLWDEEYDSLHLRRYALSMARVVKHVPAETLRSAALLCVGEKGAIPLLAKTLLQVPHVEAATLGSDAKTLTMRSATTGGSSELFIADVDLELETWPWNDGSQDLVLALEVLEHLREDPSFFLLEAHRVLRENGRLILSTPNAAAFRSVVDITRGKQPALYSRYGRQGGVGHHHEYAAGELAAFLQASGFTIEVHTTMAAYRWFGDEEYGFLHLALLASLVIDGRVAPDLLGNTQFIVARRAGRPSMRRFAPVYDENAAEPFVSYEHKPARRLAP